MQKDSTKICSPDTWIALASVLVALSALILALYEGHLDRKHKRLSVVPKFLITFVVNEEGAGWIFQNNGLGPAILKRAQVKVDETPYTTWGKVTKALGYSEKSKFSYNNIGKEIAIPPGTTTRILWFGTQPESDTVVKNRNRVTIRICFCSIYDECSIASDGAMPNEVESCKDQWAKSTEFRGTLE